MANTTLNPSDKTAAITLSGGNLVAASTAQGGVRGVDRQVTGKYYWECTFTVGPHGCVGAANAGAVLSSINAVASGSVNCAYTNPSGNLIVNGTTLGGGIGSFVAGGIACIALDCAAQLIWFRNGAAGSWNATSGSAFNPATGVGGLAVPFGGVSAAYPLVGFDAFSATITANFGDSAFTGAVPSGFTAGFPTGTPPLIAAATQIAAEQWAQGTPQAQLTQMGMEMWAASTTGTTQALLTQIALEQWGATGLAPAGGAQARVMVMA